MYSTLEDALKNVADKKDWMVFELKKFNNNNHDEYTWSLLPQGKYKTYKKAMFIADSKIAKVGITILSAVGLYFIVTQSIKLVKSGKLSFKK